jgi:hypothetical protein
MAQFPKNRPQPQRGQRHYYLIIVISGEQLDAQGLHRFHAVGISYRGLAFLVSMPPNGGKSTLAMSLLDDPEFLLISEDTPLIDLRGRIHPFPIWCYPRTRRKMQPSSQTFCDR